jgi:hypothetical protein
VAGGVGRWMAHYMFIRTIPMLVKLETKASFILMICILVALGSRRQRLRCSAIRANPSSIEASLNRLASKYRLG